MFRFFAVAVLATRLFGQDAGVLLGLSVTERTSSQHLQTAARQTRRGRPPGRLCFQGVRSQNYGAAFTKTCGTPSRSLTVKSGLPASLGPRPSTLKSDHSVLEPGQIVNLTLSQTFKPDVPLKQHPFATAYLAPFFGDQPRAILKTFDQLDPDFSAQPYTFTVRLPNTPDGSYRLIVEFTDLGSKSVPVRVLRDVMTGVAAQRARIAKLDPKKSPELASAEGHLARIELADRGEFGDRITKVDCNYELSQAKRMLADIVIGKDPFTKQYGDLQKSYRSAVDNSLQPYRLFIPSTYDGRRMPIR